MAAAGRSERSGETPKMAGKPRLEREKIRNRSLKSMPKIVGLRDLGRWGWRVSLNTSYSFESLRNLEERGIERTFDELRHNRLIL
jgi:hypothetical protein